MKRIYTLLVCSLILSSCSQEVIYEWDEKSRINTYSNWITGDICQNMVDNLDFLFQASAYRDTLRNGGDVQVVIDRQFSNPHFQVLLQHGPLFLLMAVRLETKANLAAIYNFYQPSKLRQ